MNIAVAVMSFAFVLRTFVTAPGAARWQQWHEEVPR